MASMSVKELPSSQCGKGFYLWVEMASISVQECLYGMVSSRTLPFSQIATLAHCHSRTLPFSHIAFLAHCHSRTLTFSPFSVREWTLCRSGKGLYLYLGVGIASITMREWSLSLGGNDIYVGAGIEFISVREWPLCRYGKDLYLCAGMASTSVPKSLLSLCGNFTSIRVW
ncbi:hypothetical protein CDAR_60801 [Caerostris darwini]|uniref:Uncharacterized protein n=1 Tax=Caerostris darwini TaxID=1538125 RepID=A0AAV4VI03_9ARAC|nr:hypothetical protein CDAR_60801 [Caerostris darwini]